MDIKQKRLKAEGLGAEVFAQSETLSGSDRKSMPQCLGFFARSGNVGGNEQH